MNRRQWIVLSIILIVSGVLVATVLARSTAAPKPEVAADSPVPLGSGFTYQGKLHDGNGPVDDNCEMAFRLYNDESSGGQVGGVITTTVPITGGLFTVVLNEEGEFGSTAFDGEERWLGIKVKCSSNPSFTDMGRDALTIVPYASYALSVPWSGIIGVPPEVSNPHGGAHYQNVIVVAISGGDYTSIQAAVDSITDTLAQKSLVWVAPGTYTETVTMRESVDIEGAGELATKITFTGSATTNTGTVVGADNAELRFLTVENSGGDNRSIAILNNGKSPRLTHVTAKAHGSTYNYGVFNINGAAPMMTDMTARASGGIESYGVRNNGSSPVMTDVNVSASKASHFNAAVRNNNGASPTMTGVTAYASGGGYSFGVYNYQVTVTVTHLIANVENSEHNRGMYNYESSLTVQDSILNAGGDAANLGVDNYATGGDYTLNILDSQIRASDHTLVNDPHYTTSVGNSLLEGGSADADGGTLICAGVYDENYTFYADTCP